MTTPEEQRADAYNRTWFAEHGDARDAVAEIARLRRQLAVATRALTTLAEQGVPEAADALADLQAADARQTIDSTDSTSSPTGT